MIFLNTYWTWQYVAILFFVFWTLFKLMRLYYGACRWMGNERPLKTVLAYAWAVLGTYVFHCVW